MHPSGLSVVRSTVDEFLQYHRKIEQELYQVRTNDGTSGFVVRLEGLVSQIQRIESG